jgi:hypothetical protein
MLKLTITTEDKNLNLELDNPSEAAGDAAVAQAFALFGVPHNIPSEPIKVKVKEESVKVEPAVTYVEPPRPVIKPVHLHNHSAIKAETMEEAVQEVDEKKVPEHILTGIKMSGGKPAYKCRYICPKCSHKANHYIWPNTQQVDCWNCQTSMVVTKAVKGVTLMPDQRGNFYVAGAQQPVIDLTYANQKEKINILKKHNMLDKDFKGNV